MLDYTRLMKLALADQARRSGLKIVAGLLLLLAVGFLLAALWSYLASHLGWGSMRASLAIGGGFAGIALIVLGVSARVRHVAPSADDLKQEVGAKLGAMAGTVKAQAGRKIREAVGLAGQKARRVADEAEYSADRAADRVEARASALADRVMPEIADLLGVRPETARQASRVLTRVRDSRVAPFLPVAGAFAIGVFVAHRLVSGSAAEPLDEAGWDDHWPDDED